MSSCFMPFACIIASTFDRDQLLTVYTEIPAKLLHTAAAGLTWQQHSHDQRAVSTVRYMMHCTWCCVVQGRDAAACRIGVVRIAVPSRRPAEDLGLYVVQRPASPRTDPHTLGRSWLRRLRHRVHPHVSRCVSLTCYSLIAARRDIISKSWVSEVFFIPSQRTSPLTLQTSPPAESRWVQDIMPRIVFRRIRRMTRLNM